MRKVKAAEKGKPAVYRRYLVESHLEAILLII